MRFLALFATLIVPASSVAHPTPAGPVAPRAPILGNAAAPAAKLDCIAAQTRHADGAAPIRPRRLDEMPPGKLYLSVVREVEGCQEMVLVSEERGRLDLRR